MRRWRLCLVLAVWMVASALLFVCLVATAALLRLFAADASSMVVLGVILAATLLPQIGFGLYISKGFAELWQRGPRTPPQVSDVGRTPGCRHQDVDQLDVQS